VPLGSADAAGAAPAAASTRSSAALVAAPCVTAELGGKTAPPLPCSTATTLPCETLSPTLTRRSLTTPAALDGISIDALSLSTVIRLCSSATVSPGLTRTSMTATSLKSPMSGTTTSTLSPPPVACARGPGTGGVDAADGAALAAFAGDAAGAVGAADGGGAAAPAAPSASRTSSGDPSLTLSPTLTFISWTTPAALDGISIEALSLSTVISDCSASTRSPGLTSTSMISTSLKSPMSGTLTSSAAMFLSFFAERVLGPRRTAD
jgi:hypothetical protein